MIVACAADAKKGLYPLLKSQVEAAGIDFIFYEFAEGTFTWTGLIEWELEIANRYFDQQIVFVDAWDFIMQGNRHDLERVLSKQSVLFHSDAHCWPEPHKADLYPPVSTRYRYVNGTGPAGWGHAIADLIHYGVRRFPIRGRESSIFADNDQRFWADVYLNWPEHDFPIRVDTSCELSFPFNCSTPADYNFIGKVGSRYLYTYPMGTCPVFLHLNGASKRLGESVLAELSS